MNKSFKTKWNEVLHAWVAVSEVARSRGKRGGGAVLVAAGCLGLANPGQAKVVLDGALGQLVVPSGCTTPATVPSECAGELSIVSRFDEPFAAESFIRPFVNYFLVGFSNSNSNGPGSPEESGRVTIDGGSTGNAAALYIGYERNATGTMTVTGAGSSWLRDASPGLAVVGHYGTGTLKVLDGGAVDSAGGVIGNKPGARGSATVSGVNTNGVRSTWTNWGTLTVGMAGATATLDVSDGGHLSGGTSPADPGYLRVGIGSNANGTVTISGTNFNGRRSSATFNGVGNGTAAVIGDGGTGALNMLAGGALAMNAQPLMLGTNGGTGTAKVSGASAGNLSSLSTDTSIYVGADAGSGTLEVLDGGQVANRLGTVAIGAGTGGSGTIHVSGVNTNGSASKLAAASLAIGAGPDALGTLTLSRGGIVETSNAITLSSQLAAAGVLNIGAAPGNAPVEPGTLTAPGVGAVPMLFFNGPSFLNFNHTGADYRFSARMSTPINSSAVPVINQLAGVTNLTGDSSQFVGLVDIQGGTLRVNGTLGGATAQVDVRSGGTLGGAGTIGGSVAVGDGVLAPGNSPGTLTINGNLALSSSSQLNYELGQANVAGGPLNDLTVVKGNLTLDGTLNVTQSAGGQFGAGTYRLFDYGGTLTDNGLALGSMPAGTQNSIQTSVPNQVNLINTQGLTLNWWDGDAGGRNDGLIAGGDGTWTASAADNRWTQSDGLFNGPYQNPSFAIFAGAPGTVTVDNSQGQMRVAGLQFATSGYRIEGGSVELTAGTNAIRVGDGTAAGAGTTATIASALTGAGKLDKVDAGTLVLTGANSYTGGTAISGGTLIGSAASFGSGAIANNAALVIEQPGSAAMANPIDGSGSLTVRAGGTLDYTGTGTLSGPTTVAAGTLAVNGALAASPVTVAGGATLAGSGTVGATTLQSGATIAPGNGGIGTLTVNGNYTQAAGSTYQAQVQPGTSQSDRIDVAGSANIAAGATLNVTRSGSGSFAPNVRYTVLSAQGGVNGHYALTGDTTSAFVQLKDSYDADHVYLTADQSRTFGSVGATPGQSAVGQALDRLPAGHPLGTAVAWLPNEAEAHGALDQLSGEIHASVKTAALEDSRFAREAALERLRSAACAPGASSSLKTDRAPEAGTGGCTADASGRVLWAQTFGSWGRLRGDAGAQGLERDIGGFFVGADTGIGDWRVGGLGGYSRAGADTDARGRAHTDSYHLGLYAGTQWGATALRLGAAYARHKIDTRRDVLFEGFADRPAADYHGATAQVFGEVGHRVDLGGVALEPFAGLARVQLRSGAFRERGGAAALQGDGDKLSSTFTTLGVRASAQLGDKTRLRGMLGWRHAFGDTAPESRHAFAGTLASFSAAGVPLAKNVAVLEAGIDTELAPNLKLGAAYTGQFGSGLRDHGFKVDLRWKF